jgi:hypothetical protein
VLDDDTIVDGSMNPSAGPMERAPVMAVTTGDH